MDINKQTGVASSRRWNDRRSWDLAVIDPVGGDVKSFFVRIQKIRKQGYRKISQVYQFPAFKWISSNLIPSSVDIFEIHF